MQTKDVAEFIAELQFDDLPSEVILKAKMAIRDCIGVALAGYDDHASRAIRNVVLGMGGVAESSVIGTSIKAPCNLASWVNAVLSSTLDMDDGSFGPEGHRGHPGCIVIPSSLAVSEKEKMSGKDLINAVVVGIEVALRAGSILALGKQGITSGKSGSFGAAASAAKLFGSNMKQIVQTLGITEAHRPQPIPATYYRDRSPSYVTDYARTTAMTKEVCGWAAMTGVSAALAALEGYEGTRTIFDLPEYSKTPLETLGKEWEILSLYFKPHSTCRAIHSSIDGTLELIRRHSLTADNVLKVVAGVSHVRSHFDNHRPASRYEAQMSIPFAVGCALLEGEVTPKQISWERIDDERILYQADKVQVVVDERAEDMAPSIDAGSVRIQTTGGKAYETYISYPLGEPQNPMSEGQLKRKFETLAADLLADDRIEALNYDLENLEEVDSVTRIIENII
jgi:2-methylcitrate dehydratase PrpD